VGLARARFLKGASGLLKKRGSVWDGSQRRLGPIYTETTYNPTGNLQSNG